MAMDTEIMIKKHYINILMNKPDFIEVKNSYERYCVYSALEEYSSKWQSVWFNKSYKKEIRYAQKHTCKFCFKKKQNYENVNEWDEGDDYYGDVVGCYYNCNTCGGNRVAVWKEGHKMFMEKIPYKINIFYRRPKKNMRCFIHCDL